jgi:hypothetical protein
MKHFIKTNWYKITIGSSLLIFSIGFLIRSINPVMAHDSASQKQLLLSLQNQKSTTIGDRQIFFENGWVYSNSSDFLHDAGRWYRTYVGNCQVIK